MESKFQIGSDYYKYIYQAHHTMTSQGKPVYKCCRGVEKSPNGFVLYLCLSGTGHWEAREAPEDAKEPLRDGRMVFRTRVPVEDITEPGDYDWDYWDNAEGWVNLKSTFKTKWVRGD